MAKQLKQSTFIVRMLNTQHKTWQGTITWLDTNTTQPFRSLLEMITLMDSAIAAEGAEEAEEAADENAAADADEA